MRAIQSISRRSPIAAGAAVLADAVLVLVACAAQAADPAITCESGKLGISAKYAQCRLKAEAKSVKTGDPVDYSKCNLDKFTSAETTAGMGVCPTETDQTTVKDYLDDCTSRTALWLAGGGGLPDTCEDDLSTCESDLFTTNADLATCDGDLTTCHGDLTTCEGDRTTCESDLFTTNADLMTCEGDRTSCEGDLAACVTDGLPRTGQTTAYGAGSDGNLQRGVARSFTDNGDGTITDNTTGLMWEKKSDDGGIHDKDNTYSWTTGSNNMDGTMVAAFLATLNVGGFAGYTDWRIPNIYELQSLVNFEIPYPGPAIFSEFSSGCTGGCTNTTCSCTQPYPHWSSTTLGTDPSTAWYVDFYFGDTYVYPKPGTSLVRAVRAGS